ncbi:hypothetical protein [Streptomyces sp. F-3]|nr:hypothetical protein [Streptomyces sp. F-3]
MLGGFVDVLAALQVGRIEQSDLDAVRNRADSALTAPDTAVRRLPAAAEDLLAGRPLRTLDELRAELRAVTAEEEGEAPGQGGNRHQDRPRLCRHRRRHQGRSEDDPDHQAPSVL